MGYPLKQSQTAQNLVFLLVSSTDHITGVTGATPTVTISKNGAAFASPAGAVTEIANGWYKVAGNATDSGTLGPLLLHATASGADPVDEQFYVTAYDPQDATRLGLSALPNAAAAASGGLPTVDGSNGVKLSVGTGAGQINASSGKVPATLAATDVTGNVAAQLANGVAHGGSTATLQLGSTTTTPALQVSNSGGHAVSFSSSYASGSGLAISGLSSGIAVSAGTTGNAIQITAGSTSGYGIYVVTTNGDALRLNASGTSAHGLYATGGGTGDGIHAQGGSGNGDGLHVVGNGTGSGINAIALGTGFQILGSLTGNVSGTVGSVAGNVVGSVGSISGVTFPTRFGSLAIDTSGYVTYNNAAPPTAAAIATAVWTDTTAGDFTTTGSPGKVLVGQLGGTFTTTTSSVFTSAALANAPTGGSAPTAAQIATAVWQDLTSSTDFTTAGSVGALIVADLDAKVSSRLATSSYTAPPTTSSIAAAILATPANLLVTDTSGRVLLQPTQTGVTIPTVTSVTSTVSANVIQIAGQTANAAAAVTFPASVGTSTLTQAQVTGGSYALATDSSGRIAGSASLLDAVPTTPPTTGSTPATWNFRQGLVMAWRRFTSKITQPDTISSSGSQATWYADDGTTVLATQPVTDDGTTQTQGKVTLS